MARRRAAGILLVRWPKGQGDWRLAASGARVAKAGKRGVRRDDFLEGRRFATQPSALRAGRAGKARPPG